MLNHLYALSIKVGHTIVYTIHYDDDDDNDNNNDDDICAVYVVLGWCHGDEWNTSLSQEIRDNITVQAN